MAVINRLARGLRASFWLGWLVESNWTDPFLFLIYSLVQPLAGVLVLYFMFRVLGGSQSDAVLNYFLVGSVLWPYVVNSLQGIAYTVIEDREQYAMIRYLCVAPVPYGVYLLGRAASRVVIGSIAVVITLVFAVVVLGLPIDRSVINLPYLVLGFPIGFAGIWALGFMIAALAFNLTQGAWSMPQAVGGALYLLCGAIFPITQLPPLLQTMGALLPVTYWLEVMRRGLLGNSGLSSFPSLSNEDVFVRLIITTLVASVLAAAGFAWGMRVAKATGKLDRVSNY
jgi:ABC-2 type transport system permease protein